MANAAESEMISASATQNSGAADVTSFQTEARLTISSFITLVTPSPRSRLMKWARARI